MNGAHLRQKALIPLLCGIFALLGLVGCVKHTEGYQSVKLSDNIPVNSSSARNPVIIIHGLFGAELLSPDGEKVWGKFSNQRIADKKILAMLASDKLKAGSILTHSEVTPANITVYRFKNYFLLINALRKFGYAEKDIIPFAYDWRRSVPENAVEFHKFLQSKSRLLPPGRKFDVIAHSMGGLIMRYYLQYGTQQLTAKTVPSVKNTEYEKISKVFIFGTPNCGYADTVAELCRGLAFVPASLKYPPYLLLNFKSYFCMFPAYGNAVIDKASGKAIDFYAPEFWQKLKMFRNAPQEVLTKLHENLALAVNFRNAMAEPMNPVKGIKLYLFAGNSFDTVKQYSFDASTCKLEPFSYGAGDGKILFESALAKGLIPWDGIYVFGVSHMGLFVRNDALRNLDFLLSGGKENE